jgi:hypothetical protein
MCGDGEVNLNFFFPELYYSPSPTVSVRWVLQQTSEFWVLYVGCLDEATMVCDDILSFSAENPI